MLNIFSYPINLLFSIFLKLTKNIGLALILFIIFLKIILIPLDYFLFKEEKKLTKIRNRINQETKNIKDIIKKVEIIMKIYQEERLNSFISSLVQLLLIGIFLSVFMLIRHHLIGNNVMFLNIINLSQPNINLAILVLLSQILLIINQLKEMRNTSILITGIMLPLFFILPAGFLIYWFINNLFTFLERQIFLRYEIKQTIVSINKE